MSQIIMGIPIKLVELNILLLHVFSFPSNLFCLIQFIWQDLVFMLDPIQLSFDCDQIFVTKFFKVLCIISSLGYKFIGGYESQIDIPWLVQTQL
jgi:hypothetical protein